MTLTYERALVVKTATALDLDGLFSHGIRWSEWPLVKAYVWHGWGVFNGAGQWYQRLLFLHARSILVVIS